MALTEENIADKIEVVENGSVQVRTANIVLKDGEELVRNFHRHVVVPRPRLLSRRCKGSSNLRCCSHTRGH
jgi:hypothetical protein